MMSRSADSSSVNARTALPRAVVTEGTRTPARDGAGRSRPRTEITESMSCPSCTATLRCSPVALNSSASTGSAATLEPTGGARAGAELEEPEPDRHAAVGSGEVALPHEIADEARDGGLRDAGGEGELRDRRRAVGLADDLENGDDPVQHRHRLSSLSGSHVCSIRRLPAGGKRCGDRSARRSHSVERRPAAFSTAARA